MAVSPCWGTQDAGLTLGHSLLFMAVNLLFTLLMALNVISVNVNGLRDSDSARGFVLLCFRWSTDGCKSRAAGDLCDCEARQEKR